MQNRGIQMGAEWEGMDVTEFRAQQGIGWGLKMIKCMLQKKNLGKTQQVYIANKLAKLSITQCATHANELVKDGIRLYAIPYILTIGGSTQIDELKPIFEEHPQHWKLTFTNESSEHEELVLRMQGIIMRKDLPLIIRRYTVATVM
jgi:hypothetical protein